MKKLYRVLIMSLGFAVVSGLCAYAVEYARFSSKFVKNFKDCERYEETVTTEFENKQFTTTRNIIGWKNGMCRYQETISSPANDKYRLNCKFTELQVEELYKAMKANPKIEEKFELDIYSEYTDPKTKEKSFRVSSTTTIKGNKAYIAWTKMQNNPYFCTPEKISK